MSLVYPAIALSVLAILLLCWLDPKRRRTRAQSGALQRSVVRRALVGVGLAPGLLLLLRRDGAAFVLWFGAAAVIGWIVALLFAAFGNSAQRNA